VRYNNTHLNILVSYAYSGNNKKFTDYIVKKSQEGSINFMLDSGAFTLYNAQGKRDWLTLDNYSNYIKEYGNEFQKYVMLDVIGNDEKSKENYELMLKKGLNPMFVFTMADNDFNYLKEATKNNIDICVAGGVTTKGDWIRKRYQDVYNKTSAKIHGLGYVKYPDMYQLPLASVDSSTWVQSSQAFGFLVYFNNGMKSIAYIDVLKKQKKLPYELQRILEQIKLTPKEFSNLENHRGSASIGSLIGIMAYIKYQKYSKKNGIDLFLAASSMVGIQTINHINNNLDNITYEEWKKYRKGLSSRQT
jgi:hypothetical protein